MARGRKSISQPSDNMWIHLSNYTTNHPLSTHPWTSNILSDPVFTPDKPPNPISIHLLQSEMYPLPLHPLPQKYLLCRPIHFKTYDCLTSIQLSVNPSFHPSNPIWRISSSDGVNSLHIFDETKWTNFANVFSIASLRPCWVVLVVAKLFMSKQWWSLIPDHQGGSHGRPASDH